MNKKIIIFLITTGMYISLQAKDFEPNSFNETLKSVVPVSGSILKGISVSEQLPDVTNLTLYVLVPKDKPWLCVRVESIDGIYISSSTYHVDVDTTQWVGLKYPSNHKKVIEKYGINGLAKLVSVHEKDQGCHNIKDTIVASWNKTNNQENPMILVFINSGRIKSTIKKSKSKSIQCSIIDSPSLVAFDTVCKVSKKDFTKGKWTINRSRMDNVLTPYHFELLTDSLKSVKK